MSRPNNRRAGPNRPVNSHLPLPQVQLPQPRRPTSTTVPAVPPQTSYQQLGIITERPKRPEYAGKAERIQSFGDTWPQDHQHTVEELADAGLYFAGYGDCARCFFCGGGLRNWERNDNVWVEHARWFQACPYIRSTKGQPFIDAVQRLNNTQDDISFEDVVRDMVEYPAGEHHMIRVNHLYRDPAVLAVTDEGYDKKDVLAAASTLQNEGSAVTSHSLLEKLLQLGHIPNEVIMHREGQPEDAHLRTRIEELQRENRQLREQTICKVCNEAQCSIVFLPCGHFVCCSQCGLTKNNCPTCNQVIRGFVAGNMR